MPSSYQIAEFWEQTEYFDIDLEVPGCFACGYANATSANQNIPAGERWTRAHLDRAHIIPAKDGGKVEYDNILLLCSRCHRDAPMSTDYTIMLRWAMERELHLTFFVDSYLKAFGESGIVVTDALVERFDRAAFVRYLRETHVCFHTLRSGAEFHPGLGMEHLRRYIELLQASKETLC